MNKLTFMFFLVFASASYAQNLKIDSSKSTVSFLFMDDDVNGTLLGFNFTGAIFLNDFESSVISGSVASETIDTDNWLRNRHLRNKYFETDDFPLISFISSTISLSDRSYNVNGDLKIKGISKQITFKFTSINNSLIGKALINSSDFGILIHDEISRNKVMITVTLPYIKMD